MSAAGTQNEGWFDPWLLLQALRAKATQLGAVFVRGDVVGSRYQNRAQLMGDFMKYVDMVEVREYMYVRVVLCVW